MLVLTRPSLVLGIILLIVLSISIVDAVYASPGPFLTGCSATFLQSVWRILAYVAWEGAGVSLPILVDLYKSIGGARMARMQDSVSGSGSKNYMFDNVPGQQSDRFILDVQFYDSTKQDWVHTPDKVGTMECPRPQSQTETVTLTTPTTIVQQKSTTEFVTTQIYIASPTAFLPAWFSPYGLLLVFAFVTGAIGSVIFVNWYTGPTKEESKTGIKCNDPETSRFCSIRYTNPRDCKLRHVDMGRSGRSLFFFHDCVWYYDCVWDKQKTAHSFASCDCTRGFLGWSWFPCDAKDDCKDGKMESERREFHTATWVHSDEEKEPTPAKGWLVVVSEGECADDPGYLPIPTLSNCDKCPEEGNFLKPEDWKPGDEWEEH